MNSRTSRRNALSLLGTLGLLAAAWPARADPYDDYLNSKSKQPFVSFLGRRGAPGHAFVAVGVKLEAGLIIYERFYGYYPAEGGKANVVKLAFSKVSGKLDHQWADTKWEEEYQVNISDEQREAALKAFDRWKANDPKYNLFASGGKNCSSFAAEVATAVGLKAPAGAGSNFPADYIVKLKAANVAK